MKAFKGMMIALALSLIFWVPVVALVWCLLSR